MAKKDNLSLIAKFDELCRGFNYLIADPYQEFQVFARSQDECRKKWLSAEEMCADLQKELHETRSNKGKLELQIRHVTELLKHEIQIRQRLQKEEKDLERKLALVRQIVTTDRNLTEETRDKLVSISSVESSHSYYRHDANSPSHQLLDSTSEIESSTRSILSSLDYSNEKTEDDLELSIIRSVRDVRTRISGEFATAVAGSSGTAATTATVDHSKTIKRSQQIPEEAAVSLLQTPAVIQTAILPMTPVTPKTPDIFKDGPSDPEIRRSSSGKRPVRQHNFASKVILKQEICNACKTRIRFGKSALKCTDCLGTSHIECKSSMPTPCVPTVRTPSHFIGTIADYSPATTPMIPSLIVHCANEIESRGLEEGGLYRVNVLERDIHPLKDQLLQGKMTPTQLAVINVHVLAGVLKSFLTSLKEPLVTWTMRESFTRISYISDETDVQTAVCSLVPELPQPNRDSLAFLILHLQKVAESPQCRMSLSTLAKIFAPILIGQPRTLMDNGLKKLQDMKEQQLTMEKLLSIPSDYWSCYSKYMEAAETPVYKPKRNSKRTPFFPSPHY